MSSSKTQSRELSIFAGVLSATLLSVFATGTPLGSFGSIELILFVAIPSLAGAFAGFLDSEHSVGNGVLVGLVAGLFYVMMTVFRAASLLPSNQVLFLLLTVPVWGVLGGGGSTFATRSFASLPAPSPSRKVCSACKTANPVDAVFCKNCGTKLG